MDLRKVLIKKEIKCWDDTQNFNPLNVSRVLLLSRENFSHQSKSFDAFAYI
jgi:hypothetical protein